MASTIAAANFTTNLDSRPSIFEVAAAEYLDDTVYRALNRILRIIGISQSHYIETSKIVQLLNRYPSELSAIVIATLQYFCLKKFNASFGEKFYGLERNLDKTTFINRNNMNIISILGLSFLPYAQDKIQKLREEYPYARKIQIIIKILATYRLSKPCFYLLYLSRSTNYIGLPFWLTNISLKYSFSGTKSLIFQFLEYLAFTLQFIQYWQTSENIQYKNLFRKSKKIPPPPKPKDENLTKPICPICCQEFETPTANKVTGFVYCWKCIALHMKVHKFCPVTHIPSDVDDLIRIYDNDD